ncbi:tctex1 domain-containing protein 2-like [Pseudomyrmex gracilis]|uniref:tctex1 domain-containing protein 2-like n=1 Tax=Pseudomyrmex gracilis TaxID=219809 RepID=UPI000995DE35|nr:tctex1 domain-containing protein 2-like [Pseudomyrmex gracilis]
MSKSQNKQDMWDVVAKKLSRLRFNGKALTDSIENQTKRKTLSKLSMIGFNGTGLFFHRRGDRLKIPRYQNTYRLEPFKVFSPRTVDKLIHDVMETKLSSVVSYQPKQASKLCKDIAADVLEAVNKKDYDRCKLVTQVYVVQRFQQSIYAAFQCLWDAEHDNYSYYVFENNHIYAWCCVFALYYD